MFKKLKTRVANLVKGATEFVESTGGGGVREAILDVAERTVSGVEDKVGDVLATRPGGFIYGNYYLNQCKDEIMELTPQASSGGVFGQENREMQLRKAYLAAAGGDHKTITRAMDAVEGGLNTVELCYMLRYAANGGDKIHGTTLKNAVGHLSQESLGDVVVTLKESKMRDRDEVLEGIGVVVIGDQGRSEIFDLFRSKEEKFQSDLGYLERMETALQQLAEQSGMKQEPDGHHKSVPNLKNLRQADHGCRQF